MNEDSFDQTPEGFQIAIDEHLNKIDAHKARESELLELAQQGRLSDEGNKLLNDIGKDIIKRQKLVEELRFKLENNT